MSIIPAPSSIGGHYESHTLGHGGLTFRHIYLGQPTTQPVPRQIAQRLTPPGWVLRSPGSVLEAYRPFERLSPNTLEHPNGAVYMYAVISHPSPGYQFWLWNGGVWEIARNESWCASLRYFLTHESLLLDEVADA